MYYTDRGARPIVGAGQISFFFSQFHDFARFPPLEA